jgi:hypothetical protein
MGKFDCILSQIPIWNREVKCHTALYRKSGNFGHGFILAPKHEVPKLNTPKYVTLQKLSAKIEHCLSFYIYIP